MCVCGGGGGGEEVLFCLVLMYKDTAVPCVSLTHFLVANACVLDVVYVELLL